ncbi:MAG: hypothetical protein ACK56I_01140, partial [bacterium]
RALLPLRRACFSLALLYKHMRKSLSKKKTPLFVPWSPNPDASCVIIVRHLLDAVRCGMRVHRDAATIEQRRFKLSHTPGTRCVFCFPLVFFAP